METDDLTGRVSHSLSMTSRVRAGTALLFLMFTVISTVIDSPQTNSYTPI